ncbi:long-chain-fatty-acid--CoA ligase [Sphingosinicella microcystinivorans]|uniref:long-chain-fatty-acid--CoA ligase n=1 Tax=Sphingosinicella microcystinivorans TaxID=335406 RepID=UPI0022F3BDE9|nr:long-chain-fatty-acid--CoA ligase [Sphingosinicella microcystinivorans]WBX84387.1 long-chain-fatty-acid--CoA ligase [Sphingosinicella microcystinivorans]
MKATMMHLPMTVQMIMRHGARIHAASEIASYDGARLHAASYAEVAERAARLARALLALGVKDGDRVATFCWNHQAHMEAYLAVPSLGAVLHTLNIRLFAAQVRYIVEHAEDTVLIADASLLEQLREVLAAPTPIRHLIVVGDMPDEIAFPGAVHRYEDLLAAHDPLDVWPDISDDERAAVICYTTGTTGNPKGVVYSHKSIFVHSLASMGADTFAVAQADRILLLPPMFHANAWGLPYTGWFAGARFVMPGAHLQPDHIRRLIEETRPTFTAMVPTLVNDLLLAHRRQPLDMSSFRVIVSGGSAVSPALIDRVRETWGLPVLQGWGMTETSPLCALSVPPVGTPPEEQAVWRAKSGRPVPGVEVRIVDAAGAPVPNDGESVGELQLRGPWITGAYHKQDAADAVTPDGWLRTGDVGTIDARGYVQITDRAKDVIKSGGEWISSVELEAHLAAHPAVIEAAIVAVPDPRWEERPLAVLVADDAPEIGALRAYLAERVARFWVPEYWVFVEALPKTSVGKVDKLALRKQAALGEIVYSRYQDR